MCLLTCTAQTAPSRIRELSSYYHAVSEVRRDTPSVLFVPSFCQLFLCYLALPIYFISTTVYSFPPRPCPPLPACGYRIASSWISGLSIQLHFLYLFSGLWISGPCRQLLCDFAHSLSHTLHCDMLFNYVSRSRLARTKASSSAPIWMWRLTIIRALRVKSLFPAVH